MTYPQQYLAQNFLHKKYLLVGGVFVLVQIIVRTDKFPLDGLLEFIIHAFGFLLFHDVLFKGMCSLHASPSQLS